MTIVGTRPEAIKMAPVIKELEKHSGILEPIFCVTAQHRQLLDRVLRSFNLAPDYDLDIMQENQTLPQMTARMLMKLDEVIAKEKPDFILVQGDTTTAFVASLAGFYQKITIGHVEAGLRTHNKYDPFPEEMNRCLIDVLSTLYFAPTKRAMANLMAEGIPQNRIYLTGNTVIDALLMVASKDYQLDIGIDFKSEKVILVTAHRRENFGKPLENLCEAIKELIRRNQDIEIVYPIHLNPNVQKIVYRMLSDHSRIHLIAPLDYEPFIHLMKRCYLIITDSGGVQEEAPSLGKPVLVFRNETERVEAITAGTAKLVGTSYTSILRNTQILLDNTCEYNKMAKSVNPYGDGRAAQRIISNLIEFLQPES